MADDKKSESDPNAWMLTFGDLIMLLLTFFVLLLTMKSMEKQVTQETFQYFTQDEEAAGFGFKRVDERRISTTGSRHKNFVRNSAMLKKTLKDNYYSFRKSYDVSEDQRGVIITLDSEHLFDPGKAEIRASGLEKLDMLGELLKYVSNDVLILGHTDNIPLKKGGFRSNWDLSCYRALNVFSYLSEDYGLGPTYLAPGGYGEFKPLVPNNSPENRAKNRRVEFVLRKKNNGA